LTHLRGLALLEESLLAGLLGRLVLGEVAGLAGLLQDGVVDTSDIHLGRGRNDVPGVHPSEGDAVDFEGTGDEEDTLLEVLEDDDTLAAEAASEEDDNGAGSEGLANLGRADCLASLDMLSALLFQFVCGRLSEQPGVRGKICRRCSAATKLCALIPASSLLWPATIFCEWERTFLGTMASSAG
jgi:hypothetical protein